MNNFDSSVLNAVEERIRDINILCVTNIDDIGMLTVLEAERAALVAVRQIEHAKWEDYLGQKFDRFTTPDSCDICIYRTRCNGLPRICSRYERLPDYVYIKED